MCRKGFNSNALHNGHGMRKHVLCIWVHGFHVGVASIGSLVLQMFSFPSPSFSFFPYGLGQTSVRTLSIGLGLIWLVCFVSLCSDWPAWCILCVLQVLTVQFLASCCTYGLFLSSTSTTAITCVVLLQLNSPALVSFFFYTSHLIKIPSLQVCQSIETMLGLANRQQLSRILLGQGTSIFSQAIVFFCKCFFCMTSPVGLIFS